MKENINILTKEFDKIKDLGWVKSVHSGFSGIGLTLESLLGIDTNSLPYPDFNGIEIKAKRCFGRGFVTLFNCVPTGPHIKETERIKDDFGYRCKELPEYKILNCSVYSHYKSRVGYKYFFELKIDREKEKLFLLVFDVFGNLVEDVVYWDFDILKEKLMIKTSYLGIFLSYVRKIDCIEYFKYYKLLIYHLKGFDDFIDLIERGIIRINFKVNIYKTEERKGQLNNHGVGFDININDFSKLYNLVVEKE